MGRGRGGSGKENDMKRSDEDLKKAFIESFALHYRNLMDFFYPNNPREDDVLASHFIKEGVNWDAIRPVFTNFGKNRRRVGKEVAHLTYARISVLPEEKEWNRAEAAGEIITIFSLFLENIRDDLIGPEWNPYRVG